MTRHGPSGNMSAPAFLNVFGASQLDEALEGFITDDDPAIVIDMGNVSYLSSAGIRTLIAAERTLGGEMAGFTSAT
jgi:anti-anti-sigma regulatory factor